MNFKQLGAAAVAWFLFCACLGLFGIYILCRLVGAVIHYLNRH